MAASNQTAVNPIKFLRIDTVCELVGLKRAGLYRIAQQGTFPKPIRISTRASGWVESEVLEWLNARIAIRDARLTKRVAA